MIVICEGAPMPGQNALTDSMYRDRKRVFVDRRKWAVPVVEEQFEFDQFDGPEAVYCIATDDHETHLGSIRLLPTDQPHILGDLFPDLCDGPVPRGLGIREMTRGCLSPGIDAPLRRLIRNQLTTAVVAYALERGICSYTCVADSAWLRSIALLGWDCRPLGTPRIVEQTTTGALQIHIRSDTIDRLKHTGCYAPTGVSNHVAREAAHV